MVHARRFGFGILEFEAAAVGGAAGAELPVAAGAGVPVAAAAAAVVGFSSELGDAESWFAVAEAGGSAPGCDMVAAAGAAAGFSQRAGSKRRGQ